jgi:hypothetical protein
VTDPISQVLDDRFATFANEVSRAVNAPGTDSVRQIAQRRQRLQAVSLAVLLLVLGVGGAFAVAASRQPGGPPVVPGASKTTAAPTNSPTAVPTTAGSSPSPTGPPVDLRLVADAAVGLQVSGNHYVGTLYLTVTNAGPTPYKQTIFYLTLPPGISLDSPTFGGCVAADPPETWKCFGTSVPALGGSANYSVGLIADYAPQTTDTTLEGFSIRVAADLATGVPAADLNPADNTVHTRLILLAK